MSLPKQILIVVIIGFRFFSGERVFAQTLMDKAATAETKALYANLKYISAKGTMFGHQEDLAYGVGWKEVAGRSDVKEVCGDYPAVHGWDIGKEGLPENVDGVRFSNMQQWIREVYGRGGVNTISWHVNNPVSGKSAWDTTRAVVHILPGGKLHNDFLIQLDHVAAFLAGCTNGETPIPIIFRPYHEHNGTWFWWGKNHCTEQEYIQLWQFTVDYLKNTKGLHHIIYAFSPDRSRMDVTKLKASFLYAYPGDDYVDVMGLDDYRDVGVSWNKRPRQQQANDFTEALRTLTQLSIEKNKPAALTETGLEGITNDKWFTEVVLKQLKQNKDIQLAWFLVWRNANEKHHYAPFRGHLSEKDFVQFYNDPLSFFEADLRNIYKSDKLEIKP